MMADGFGYGGFSGAPYPFWLSSSSPHPSASESPFPATYPVNLTQGVFDPMNSHGSNHRLPSDWSNSPSYGGPCLSQTPSPSYYVNNGNLGPYTYVLPQCGSYPSSSSSSDFVPLPTNYLSERQMPYKSFSVSPVEGSSSADMLTRNSFYNPILSSGNAFDEKRPGQYHHGYDKPENMSAVSGPPLEPCLPVPSFPQALFDRSQTGAGLGDGRSFSHAPENVQSSLRGSSVEPVNFNVLLGYGEATGHVNPVGSTGSLFKEKREGSGVSSLYQTPKTFVADSENGVSETSLKNAIDDLNCDEHNHFMVSSEGPSAPTMFSVGSEPYVAMKADNENAAQPAVNCKTPYDGSANQPSEDVQASECKLQKQMFDMTNRDNNTTLLTNMGIKGSSKSNASSPRVSSVISAMHNLSEVLVYECFNNGSWMKPEQVGNLDKVVENLTKCLNKIIGNKTITGEASIPTQDVHVSCLNVVDLNEASNVTAKDCNDQPLASFGLKEPVDKDKNKDEMTQSIKNILASNFPDGEENHPQTLLYKRLWLETEAALCSTTCMTRYQRIKNETEISADASTYMQEPFLSVMKNVEQETTDSFIKHGSSSGNDIVTMSHDAPQSSRFNSDPVNALLSLMSRSFMGGLEQEHHGNFKPDAATSAKIPDTIQQESPASTTEEQHDDVIDRFQILKQQETKRKLKSQTRIDDQEENPEANIGRSSQMSDVVDRFEILKRREAEQVQESLNSLDIDSESDEDQPRNKTQICDHLWSDSMMTTGGSFMIETCANTEEPSASGEGYESPTSDWEHVRNDN